MAAWRRPPGVVVGVDFSEASRRAVDGAGLFAAAAGARVVLVHAVPHVPRGLAGAAKGQAALATHAAARREMAVMTKKWAAALRNRGLEVQVITGNHRPDRLILQEASRPSTLLLEIGSTGKGLLRRALLGSTAHAALARSPVPVLVFPDRSRAPRGRMGPLVVGLQLDAGGRRLLDAAAAVARDLGTKIHAVHAIDLAPAAYVVPEAGIRAAYSPEMLARDEQAAGQTLTAWAEPLRPDVEIETFVRLGDPATSLAGHAEKTRAACIVAGRRGKRIGPVALDLLQISKLPILVVPLMRARRK